MFTTTNHLVLLVAASGGPSNVVRVARAIGASTSDVFNAIDLAEERSEPLRVRNDLLTAAARLRVAAADFS